MLKPFMPSLPCVLLLAGVPIASSGEEVPRQGLEAAEPALSPGTRIRLMTAAPPRAKTEDGFVIHGRVLHQDASSVTFQPPGEKPATRTKEGRWLVGEVVAADERLLSLRVPGQSDPLALPREDITRLEVSRGKKSHWKQGVVVGGMFGLLTALAASQDSGCPAGEPCFEFISPSAAAAFLGGIGAGAGALVGALISTDRWETVPAQKVAVGIVPVRGHGVAFGVRLAF